MEQHSSEWYEARLGKCTASRISEVMAGGDGLTRARYMGELISEKLMGVPVDGYTSADTERGNELEDEARALYQVQEVGQNAKATITACGFVNHPSIEGAGASPDRYVGDDGLLEIKCPRIHNHIKTFKTGAIDRKYKLQMQFQMACTGRLWCDFVSYCPLLPARMNMKVIRVHRDEKVIAELNAGVRQFIADMDAEISALENPSNPQPKGETNDRTKSFDI